MLKKFWRPETGIFLGIWLVLMVGGRSRFFRDPGTFWHTVVGGQILSSHRLIYSDPFSFTFQGKPWIAHQWLGECAMGAFHRIDQFDSLLLAAVTVLAALYTWVAHRLIRAGLHWSLAILLTALVIAASSSHFHVRPHLGTIVFLGITYAFLCDFESGHIPLYRLFLLVPVFLIWTNVHGGMLGGLFTLVITLTGWFMARLLRLKTPVHFRQFLPLGFLVAFCGLTAFLNPYGRLLPSTWLEIMDSPALPKLIQEHSPLDPTQPEGWIVLVLAGVYVLALLGTLPGWPRVTWLVPLIWFYLACTRIRHAPLFSITAAMALADILPHTRWARWLARPGSDLFRFSKEEIRLSPDWKPALLPMGVVMAALFLQALGQPVPILGHGWAKIDNAYWPIDLLPQLQRVASNQTRDTPIFNDLLYGGFLIYYAPGSQVFVDDRCELYGDHWLEEYVAAERGQDTAGRMRQWEETYPNFNLALTRTGSEFDVYFQSLPEDWLAVQRTDTATLYRRRTGPDPTEPALASKGLGSQGH